MRATKLIWLVVLVFLPLLSFSQQITRLIISSMANPELKAQIELNISTFLTECNRASCEKDKPRAHIMAITKEAKDELSRIWNNSGFACTESELIVNIVRNPDGNYELRGIPIVFCNDDSGDDDSNELVLILTPTGLLSGIKVAIEKEQYSRLLLESDNVKDRRLREVILSFVETYRTAYNRKDLDYINTVFSEDAIIIVGRLIKTQKNLPDKMGQTLLTKDQVELIRLSKTEYIKNLQTCFKKNHYIKVAFQDFNITRHPKFPEIYGVTLRQKWSSSTYSDDGYLFLMIDFKDETKPLIWVRSWQPEKFTKSGDAISLNDFIIQ